MHNCFPKNDRNIEILLKNFIELLITDNNYDEAQKLLEEYIQIFNRNPDFVQNKAHFSKRIGFGYERQKNYIKSEKFLKQSI